MRTVVYRSIPCSIDTPYRNGDFAYYFKDGRQHRDGGPAVENPLGSNYWMINGKSHREDGPSDLVLVNGIVVEYWYRNGSEITKEVVQWLSDNPEIPHWKEWSDADKILFKLRFL